MSTREGTIPWSIWYTTDNLSEADAGPAPLRLSSICMRTPQLRTHTFLLPHVQPNEQTAEFVYQDEAAWLTSWCTTWRRFMPAQALLAGFNMKNRFAPLFVNRCIKHRIKPPTWMCMSLLDRFNSNRCLVEISTIYTQGNSKYDREPLTIDEMFAYWGYDVGELDMPAIVRQLTDGEVPDFKAIDARMEACYDLYENYNWS